MRGLGSWVLPLVLLLPVAARADPSPEAEFEGPEDAEAPSDGNEGAEPAVGSDAIARDAGKGRLRYAFSGSSAYTPIEEPVRITVEPLGAANYGGFGFMRLAVSSPDGRPHVAEVTLETERRAVLRRTVDVPASGEVRFSWTGPLGPAVLRARVGDKEGRGQVYMNAGQGGIVVVGSTEPFIRVVGQPATADPRIPVATLTPGELPREAGAYFGLRSVVLVRNGTGIDDAQGAALEHYVLTGGTLFVAPGVTGWEKVLGLAAAAGRHGFGRVVVCQADRECRRELARAASDAVPPINATAMGAHHAATVLPEARPETGVFIIVIAVYVLLVGPGALVVARRRGAASLLVTVPTTALVTTLLIGGVAVLLDGRTLKVRTLALSWLLADGRTATLTAGAFYANGRLGPMKLSPNAAVVAGSWTDRARLEVGQDPSRLGAGFIPPRLYTEWAFTDVGARTDAGLSVTRTTGGGLVLNRLGEQVEQVELMLDGKRWSSGPLPAGGSAPLVEEYVARFNGRPVNFDRDEPLASRFSAGTKGAPFRPEEDGDFLAILAKPASLPLEHVAPVHRDSVHYLRGRAEVR